MVSETSKVTQLVSGSARMQPGFYIFYRIASQNVKV